MLNLGMFESSLRGSATLATPSTTLGVDHKCCSGEAHGGGIDKGKRATCKPAEQTSREVNTSPHYHPSRNYRGKESLPSVRRSHPEVNRLGSSALSHTKYSHHARYNKMSTLPNNNSNISQSPSVSLDEKQTPNPKPFASESFENGYNKMRVRRIKRNQRVTEHVDRIEDDLPKKNVLDTGNQPLKRGAVSRKCTVSKVKVKIKEKNDEVQSTKNIPFLKKLVKQGSVKSCSTEERDLRRKGSTKSFSLGHISSSPVSASWSEQYQIVLDKKRDCSANLKPVLYKDLDDLLIERAKQLVENELANALVVLSSTAEDGEIEAKSEQQLASEQAWQESERLWLVHRAGFTAARKIPGESNTTADPDTVKIHLQLEATGDTLYVDDDDVERANPPQFDHSEDLSQLRYVNESSILHSLRQRYASNLIHTHAGGSMIIINPMAPLAIYSEKVMHMFRGCKSEDMPPHIYSLAQSTYRSMLTSRRDHSILLLGRSGSGKTINFKHILHYLVLTVGSVNKAVIHHPSLLDATSFLRPCPLSLLPS
uniref:Myosin motor domain-containing protein n=1 Tax=Timema monikensis TaxID=170555 RepID=A0A7R9E8L5_9NEOP|nr:unnamed protein product [Timema monikensis]